MKKVLLASILVLSIITLLFSGNTIKNNFQGFGGGSFCGAGAGSSY